MPEFHALWQCEFTLSNSEVFTLLNLFMPAVAKKRLAIWVKYLDLSRRNVTIKKKSIMCLKFK